MGYVLVGNEEVLMQDFYEKMVKEKLKRYTYAKDFIKNAENQVEELETKKQSKLTSTYGTAPLFGGGSSQEDKIININAKIEMLNKNINNNKKIVRDVEYGLKGLSDEEIDITLTIYGQRQGWNKIDKLKEEYHYSKTRLYEIAKSGLEHISYRLYGEA